MKELQICGAIWKVKEIKSKTLHKKAKDCDGYTDFDNQLIYLNSELNEHRKKITLVHEALHVIFDHSGYEPHNDERVIRSIEHGVYELIQKFPT